MVKTRNYEDDLRERLKDPEYAAGYLNAVLEDLREGEHHILLIALRDVAEAQQMAKVASGAGVNRENLYRMLSENGNPRLSSLLSVLNAIGLHLSVGPTRELEVESLRKRRGIAKGHKSKVR